MKGYFIVFDIEGEFAHFRKFYVNAPVMETYLFPPPTSVRGLVGAILGLSSEITYSFEEESEYLKELGGLQVAVRLLSPVRLIKYKFSGMNYKLVSRKYMFWERGVNVLELVVEPRYRIYLRGGWERADLEEAFIRALESGKSVFTPYLGKSFALAQVTFIGIMEFSIVNGVYEVQSVLNLEDVMELNLFSEGGIYLDRIPSKLDSHRRGVEYTDVAFTRSAEPISAVLRRAYLLDSGEVLTTI